MFHQAQLLGYYADRRCHWHIKCQSQTCSSTINCQSQIWDWQLKFEEQFWVWYLVCQSQQLVAQYLAPIHEGQIHGCVWHLGRCTNDPTPNISQYPKAVWWNILSCSGLSVKSQRRSLANQLFNYSCVVALCWIMANHYPVVWLWWQRPLYRNWPMGECDWN